MCSWACATYDYAFVTGDAGTLDDAYAFTGTAFSMASGRVSYSMGLRGPATNQDGRTDTIATPSLDAQVVAYRAALAAAGVDADTVGMVEAHGTGTLVGDRIEFASLAQGYGREQPGAHRGRRRSGGDHQSDPVAATQCGAADGAPHPAARRACPDRDRTVCAARDYAVADERASERSRTPTRGSLVVRHVGQQRARHSRAGPRTPAQRGETVDRPQLFGLSATSAEALRQTSRRLADWIDGHTDTQPVDLAYTLARRREHRPVRTGLIAAGHSELIERLRELADGDSPCQTAVGQDDRGPVWIFSGQGSQWPEIRRWVEFFEGNDGSLPSFPLPLGDTSLVATGELLSLQLLDAGQTARFEAACTSAGARFSGGVFACAALAEYELTGSDTYHAVTPTSTRSTPAEFMTTGWFIGHIPFAVEVGSSFGETARSAQASFDSSSQLANVPFERVLELALWFNQTPPRGGLPMLSFLDAGVPPLSAVFALQLDRMNTEIFSDGRIAARVCMWVNKFQNETTVTASFPNNPIAHESVARYLTAIKSVYVRVAEGRADRPSEVGLARNGAQLQWQRL